MSPILVLAAKDLRRRLAAPFELVITLAIPLILAGLMALVFSGLGSGAKGDVALPKVKLVVVDLDRTVLTRFALGATQNDELAERLEVKRAATREAGLARLYDEKAAALLVLPQGLTEAVTGGTPVEVELVKNPAQSILPDVAEKGADLLVFYLSLLARGLGDEGALVRGVLNGREWPEPEALLTTFTRMKRKLEGTASTLFPPRIKVVTEKVAAAEAKSSDEANVMARVLASLFPGIMVMGLLFVGNAQMKDLLQERVAGTLRRQLTAPVSADQVLVAKMLAASAVAAVGLAILLLAGRLTFGIHWKPPGTLLLASVALVLVVVGFSSTLFSIVRSERQADAIGAILVMVLTFLGGAFMPLNDPPAWLAVVSRGSPVYWASQAFRVFAGGVSAEPLARSLGVLAALGVGLSGLGALLMRIRHLRGAL